MRITTGITLALLMSTQAGCGGADEDGGVLSPTGLAELTMFPKGKHDDQVDSSVIAFNEVALGARRGFKLVKVRGMH